MSDISKIKERIRKLFNLASNDAAADGEIENALKAARELMLAHQLSDDDVNAEQEDLRSPEQVAAETEYGTSKSWGNTGRVPRWQGTLARAVADFIGTVNCYRDSPAVYRRNGFAQHDGEKVAGWVFFGPHDDVVMASELHQELLLTCATAAKLKFGGSLLTGSGRDYCDGFARGLLDKVRESQEAVRTAAVPKLDGQQCTALSLVRAGNIAVAKRDRASEWLKKEHGIRLRTSYGYDREVGDDSAYREGHADGGSQTLAKTRIARIGN